MMWVTLATLVLSDMAMPPLRFGAASAAGPNL